MISVTGNFISPQKWRKREDRKLIFSILPRSFYPEDVIRITGAWDVCAIEFFHASLVRIRCRPGDASGIRHAFAGVRSSRKRPRNAVMPQMLPTNAQDGSFLIIHLFLLQSRYTATQFLSPD